MESDDGRRANTNTNFLFEMPMNFKNDHFFLFFCAFQHLSICKLVSCYVCQRRINLNEVFVGMLPLQEACECP